MLPTTEDLLPVVFGSISSQPSLGKLWIFLFCWAAPARARSFLVAMDRQPGAWFLLGLCVQKAASAPPARYFPLGRESRQRRGQGSGGRDSPRGAELLGTASPGSGDPSASSSSDSLQGPPWHWGPLGPVPSVPSGCSCSPALLQPLLIAGTGDSQRWELFSGC